MACVNPEIVKSSKVSHLKKSDNYQGLGKEIVLINLSIFKSCIRIQKNEPKSLSCGENITP